MPSNVEENEGEKTVKAIRKQDHKQNFQVE